MFEDSCRTSKDAECLLQGSHQSPFVWGGVVIINIFVF
jgi:hypothetical protein